MPDETNRPAPRLAEPAEKMLKRTLGNHLRAAHGTFGDGTRDQLRDMHKALHEGADLHAMGVATYPADFWYTRLRGYPTRPLAVNHTHGDVGGGFENLTPEQQATVDKLAANEPISEKPLTASERTVLARLVDNSFGRTKTQVQQMAAEAWQAKKRDIEADWKAKVQQSNKYTTLAQKIIEKANEQYAKLVEAAEADGITLSKAHYTHRDALIDTHNTKFTTSVEGLAKAIKSAEDEHNAMLRQALLQLEEQRLIVQARVLRSALTPKTAEFLDTLPTAQEALLEARKAEGAKQLEG